MAAQDDSTLKKVLGQKQPAIVVFYDGSGKRDKPLEDAVKRAARKHAGDLLVIEADIAETPEAYARYGRPETPALVTLTKAFFGRKVKSEARRIRPADVRSHIDHLLNDTPLPEAVSESAAPPSAPARGGPLHVTDASFRRDVLKSKTPVLVDFWAPWCGPCNAVAPFVEKLAGEYAGRVKVVKLNVDENPVISRRFQVLSIPTFIVFENGQPLQRSTGSSPRAIQQLVDTALAD